MNSPHAARENISFCDYTFLAAIVELFLGRNAG